MGYSAKHVFCDYCYNNMAFYLGDPNVCVYCRDKAIARLMRKYSENYLENLPVDQLLSLSELENILERREGNNGDGEK